MVELEAVLDSAVAGLARNLDHDMDEWFRHMLAELPETLRINPMRKDMALTTRMLKEMGGKPMQWFPGGLAFSMPWSRKCAPQEHRDIYACLHDSGRTTRQEAASMLPVIALDPQPGEKVLDMCAAPGSKSTQISEMMNDTGVLVANDFSSARLNTLTSNRGRLGLANMVLTKHDGRHFPAVPDPGFDAILVDVPCSGSATMRKNKHVWWEWKQQTGRAMMKLQKDILHRACALLRPGGRLVYSTCSLDPLENETVVNSTVEKLEYMELLPINTEKTFPGLLTRPGICNWKDEIINWDNPSLEGTIRLAPEDNDSGGFFLALLHHHLDSEQTARALTPRVAAKDMKEAQRFHNDPRLPSPAPEASILAIKKRWGIADDDGFSWWQRGKKISISTPQVREWLWDQQRTLKRRFIMAGGHWNPLNVIHAGSTAFQPSKDGIRPRSEALPLLSEKISVYTTVDDELVALLLDEEEPLVDDVGFGKLQGYHLLRSAQVPVLPVWAGARLSLMINRAERKVLLAQARMQAEDSS